MRQAARGVLQVLPSRRISGDQLKNDGRKPNGGTFLARIHRNISITLSECLITTAGARACTNQISSKHRTKVNSRKSGKRH